MDIIIIKNHSRLVIIHLIKALNLIVLFFKRFSENSLLFNSFVHGLSFVDPALYQLENKKFQSHIHCT
jgi:hypothetical protein